jgi:hypothetical protein
MKQRPGHRRESSDKIGWKIKEIKHAKHPMVDCNIPDV